VLGECTTEEQLSIVRLFLWAKGISAKDIHKEMFPAHGGGVCCVKLFSTGSRKSLRDEEDETAGRNWLKQHLKDFYAAGFDALVKQWDKCISVRGGYVEK
jgi:hypothetical protein